SFYASFFILYSSHHHLLFHSFPTRRSSDLAGLVFMKVFEFVIPSAGFSTGLPIGKCPLSLKDGKLTKEIASLALIRAVSELSCRSEEHTSELQSRENLVCRLLLEKKKKLIK